MHDNVLVLGPSFDYAAIPDLVAGRPGFGPLWVTWDTNVLSLYEEYAAHMWELRIGQGYSRSKDCREKGNFPVRPEHDPNEVYALADLVTIWMGWDLRFQVTDITLVDSKRPPPADKRKRRAIAIEGLAQALALGLDGEQTYPERRLWPLPETLIGSLPKGKDRLLVQEAYEHGADVFLTGDKRILRCDQRLALWGMRCMAPSAVVSRLVGAGLRRGFYLDYLLGNAPDLARMSALMAL